jgi:type IV pilus assembly protein PilB
MAVDSRKGLADILLEQELLTKEQLGKALRRHRGTGRSVTRLLSEMGFVSEDDIVVALGQECGVPYMRLAAYNIADEVVHTLPESVSVRHMLIPVSHTGNVLTLAMADPFDVTAIDEVRQLTGCEIETMVAKSSEIRTSIDKAYHGIKEQQNEFFDSLGKEGEQDDLEMVADTEDVDIEQTMDEAGQAPIIKLVNFILARAIEEGASDIHVEPYEKTLRVRYRVDGKLEEFHSPPKSVQAALTSRLKIMCDMDITEHRLPQDARFRIKYRNREIDFRVSTVPTYYGEKVVMRLLDKASVSLGLAELNFEPEPMQALLEATQMPYGMILMSGPTGSGKTTTLYSMLTQLNDPDVNIVTVEDPVEYELAGINQIPIRSEVKLTFAAALRSILRQDPDIIMVGEMRDQETADIAVKAALTGHLVLSTLHANDAASVPTRLMDMGLEPYLISSGLLLSAAQRLVRRICPDCKEAFYPPRDVLDRIQYKAPDDSEPIFFRARGCKKCKDLGYKGRVAVIECLLVRDEIQDLIMARVPAGELKHKAVELGMKTLRMNALAKAVAGHTTIDEVLRVTAAD